MSTQNAQPENVAAFDPLRAYRANNKGLGLYAEPFLGIPHRPEMYVVFTFRR